uniref:Photosystem I assembly protein Ycf4 n=1 Tax=Apophlaea sinclairii TaxID=212746 RepID=A0A1C9CBJ9_9FLOR|nr:photosystem I assembly protein Ycf4 [Apophlaea sinclairii]AOM65745.1 photosystem I assembly protein Ycf4 [Apophlaea sinclairii]
MNQFFNTETRKDIIIGSRRWSNYIWGIITSVGGISFVLAGLSSYLKMELLTFTTTSNLAFIPQGIVMIFYGITATFLSLFLWVTIIFDVGSGYNEFNKISGLATIFRFGFPGRNRKILLVYELHQIISVQIKIKDGLNPIREIYLKTNDQKKIPITRVGQPLYLLTIEQQAADLAKFLNVLLEKI